MKIANHLLYLDEQRPAPFVKSPNFKGKLQSEYLVIHYTAGHSMQGAVAWLTNPRSQAAAHLVIGSDGSVVQLVPFDTVAWHAGASMWEGRIGLNQYSIGIELDNIGRLQCQGDHWRDAFGKDHPEEDGILAKHKNEKEPCGWHVYPQAQMETLFEISLLLFQEYKLLDVVGHDDISPFRKWDPGPAFPMDSFRARLAGRIEVSPPLYETTIPLNIRSGPGSQYKTLTKKPLPKNMLLEKLKGEGSWMLVDVIEEVEGIMDLQGWVHGRYVQRAPSKEV